MSEPRDKRGMTPMRKTWLWAAVLVPLGLLSAAGCGRVEVGVVETPAGSPDLAGTVSALSTENVRLVAQAAPSPTTARPGDLDWLAYVQGGDIWVEHLPDGEPRRLTTDGGNLEPRWSLSGDWLAYRKGEFQVWMHNLSDGEARTLNEGRTVAGFDWSPLADRVAYASGSELYVESGDGTTRTTVLAQDLPGPGRGPQGQIGEVEWSPTGEWIAYEWRESIGEGPPSYQGILVVSPDGGVRGEAFAGEGTIAGWTSDGRYLLLWEGLFGSASLAADGVRLLAVAPEGGEPITVSKVMLPYADFVAVEPTGSDRVATISGGGREAWTVKDLTLGSISAEDWTARSLPTQAASSPSWSFDGARLAFAAMPAQDPGAMLQGEATRRALMERHIWVLDTGDGAPTQITRDDGYRDERPLWSADGATILFARLDEDDTASLWVMPAEGGEPQQVVEELTPSPGWFGYYGHIEWDLLFNWWRGSADNESGMGELPPAPSPWPTPGAVASPWDQIIDAAQLQGVTWSEYRGSLLESKGATRPLHFQYPSAWQHGSNESDVHASIQNIPESPKPPAQDFVKFEILWLDSPPSLEEGQGDPQEWRTVIIAGENAALRVRTEVVGRSRSVSAAFPRQGHWIGVFGYIRLQDEDPALLDHFTGILLSMMASLTIGD